MKLRYRVAGVAATMASLTLFQPAGADGTDAPGTILDVTGDPRYAPLLDWDLRPDADGASCEGWSSVRSPILPPGVDSWQVHMEWTACVPVVTFVGITKPLSDANLRLEGAAAYTHMTVTTRDTMSTATGSETTVNNAQYAYDQESAYIESSGGWCRTSGGWVNTRCTPDIWNFGPYEPRGALVANYRSHYWPYDPHERDAITGAYPGGGIQGECKEHGDLPWSRSTSCETRRGTTYP